MSKAARRVSLAGSPSSLAETAYWTAGLRADESLRPDRLLNDPFAQRLAGPKGRSLVQRAGGLENNRAQVVRARAFDEMLAEAIDLLEVSTVLDLGAGLDARPFRLSLPPTLDWVAVDLPEVTAYREGVLAAQPSSCRSSNVACDLEAAEPVAALGSWLSAHPAPAMVMMEGLARYLSPQAMGRWSSAIFGDVRVVAWLFDLFEGAHNGPLPPDPLDEVPPGWRVSQVRSLHDEALRLVERAEGAATGDAERQRRLSRYVLLSRDQ